MGFILKLCPIFLELKRFSCLHYSLHRNESESAFQIIEEKADRCFSTHAHTQQISLFCMVLFWATISSNLPESLHSTFNLTTKQI